jgi:hypothetical protein
MHSVHFIYHYYLRIVKNFMKENTKGEPVSPRYFFFKNR